MGPAASGGTVCNHRGLVTSSGEAVAVPAPPAEQAAAVLGESRLPPAAAVVCFIGLNVGLRVWLPNEGAIRVVWLLPAIEIALLVVLLAADPSSLARHSLWLRRICVALVVLLVIAALWSTILLVYDLIQGLGVTDSPSELLATGAVVWLGNNLSFALLYWLMDGGGPVARSRRAIPVDLAFTQQLSPEIAPSGWRPVFLDYLHLGFTNATAFSPTDVMPLTLRAKYTMLVQSTVALALFGLIVARAVNAFT